MQYGLIGERLGHSFSKIIHEKIAPYSYTLLELDAEALDGFLRERGFSAINVTIPYKEKVIPYLDYIDDGAKQVGAVNTVVNRDGKLYGYNTDVYGMNSLLGHMGISLTGRKVAILGSGGTAKTSLAVARMNGAREIITVSRRESESAICYDRFYREHADTEVIINTTPVGMYPNPEASPIDLSGFKSLIGVVDAIYNPLRTSLILDARERGIAAEGGLYMLVAQAVRAVEIFLSTTLDPSLIDKVYEEIIAERENIVLIGMPSSGKSTVGKFIADKLGRELTDTDALIVKRTGRDIPSIFREDGERPFRELESMAVSEAANSTSMIIATGGGAILAPKNVRALRRSGRLYFIDRPIEKLIPTSDRPLSSSIKAIKQRYNERYPIYTSVADVTVDGGGSVDEVGSLIIKEFCK